MHNLFKLIGMTDDFTWQTKNGPCDKSLKSEDSRGAVIADVGTASRTIPAVTAMQPRNYDHG